MIEISNLSKTYASGFEALKDINLSIKKGEIFALLGPNGAGKTTLIGCVVGLVQPTEGTITIGGYNALTEYRKARALIGLVPQEIMIDIFETVWNTLVIARGYFGKKQDPELYERILKDLSLWDKKDSKIQELSGGMKRRVLIARALTNEPEVLFLDEPTAGVDVELRRGMMEVVKKLQQRGTTVILTTHYIEEAEELADRVGIIVDGKLELVEDKTSLMKRLGHKTLSVMLSSKLDALPTDLKRDDVTLSDDGFSISYKYKAGEKTGITSLLSDLKTAGIEFEDIDTEKSSLEEIFVSLVKE
jgi:ABC-2 type transport system ATP-binding protein